MLPVGVGRELLAAGTECARARGRKDPLRHEVLGLNEPVGPDLRQQDES